MTRVAAVDCGTNTVRLLVADLDPDSGTAVDIERRTRIVRLGQDVDKTGEFAPEALERAFAVLDDYAAVIRRLGAERVRVVATSAARDVSNREEFVDGVRSRLGVAPEVITGEEEAWLTYDGATRPLVGRPDVVEPVLVLDIGGGSTEFVIADEHTGRIRGVSVDVGSVRMTERHLRSDPPTRSEVAAVEADVNAALDDVDRQLGLDAARTLVGVAGTVTTIGAMVLGLDSYDAERLGGARLARTDVEREIARLVAMTIAERRALTFMPEGRADVIAGGAIVLGCVLERVGLPDLIVSEHDILDGAAWRICRTP